MANSELIEIIRAEIGANGPISFARFIELALYHPDRGYYASWGANIGRPGDFEIVEQGAHDGLFAADALRALRQSAGDCFAATSYCIVEPFPIWQERQKKNLHEFAEKTSWVASIDEIAPFVGIHFSNELFDSLPVHL